MKNKIKKNKILLLGFAVFAVSAAPFATLACVKEKPKSIENPEDHTENKGDGTAIPSDENQKQNDSNKQDNSSPTPNTQGSTVNSEAFSKEELNKVAKALEFSYQGKENTDILSIDKQNISSNVDTNKYAIENLSVTPNKKLNNLNVSYQLKYKDEAHKDLISDVQNTIITEFAITQNYLNQLLNSESSVFSLFDSTYPEGGAETVKTLDAKYLEDGTIDVRIENNELFIPEESDFNVDFTYDSNQEENTKFNGNVVLSVRLVYKNINTENKSITFNDAIQPGVTLDILKELKGLSFDYTNKENTNIISFEEERELTSEQLENLVAKFNEVNGGIEGAKIFLPAHEISIQKATVYTINYDTNSVEFKIKLQSNNQNNHLDEELYLTIWGFQGITKADDTKVKDFVNKLTFGDIYFVSEIKADNEKSYDLYISESGNINDKTPYLDSSVLFKNGITEFNKEHLYTVTFDEENNDLVANMTLNGKEYVIKTHITRSGPNLDEFVNEIGKEIKGDKSEISAATLSNNNIELKVKFNNPLPSTPFITFKTIYAPKANLELNKIGKAELVYVFFNETTRNKYEKTILFEGLKPVVVSNSSIAEKARANELASGSLSAQTAASIRAALEKTGDKEDEYSGRIEFDGKHNKLLYGNSKKTAKNEFTGITFDNEFIEAVKLKQILPAGKTKYLRFLKIKDGDTSIKIPFKLKNDQNNEIFYVVMNIAQ
ncbi:hypothetical protein [Metamycoplasma neophronis]|uniref:Variable surface lipoprotein n=1 Tax=Metamycoplasma neophronis TaxID=872983 RepID=A0ABY2Z0B3_9BACT|nr:hypothetical protein [Metamycoplasma neophronis]TPR54322.1 hypothetical protein FJR74_00900 [Metamycoplasma neophronis]